jgi:hypothetical protein
MLSLVVVVVEREVSFARTMVERGVLFLLQMLSCRYYVLVNMQQSSSILRQITGKMMVKTASLFSFPFSRPMAQNW